MSHGDKVSQIPEGFTITASTPSCPVAAVSDETRRFYGVQFHPEVTHTAKGEELLLISFTKFVDVVAFGHLNTSSIYV